MKEEKLLKLENFPMIEPKEIDTKEDTFQRLMFIYSSALKDMENKIGQLKEQFEYLYNYNLIDMQCKRRYFFSKRTNKKFSKPKETKRKRLCNNS